MTTNVKKKKSAREKRILVASLIVAAVMIGGSTFAWFTSKDEVTNRLSASADYGVSIVEDFTPPENMTPGQTVNKDVSVVNTGNIDAFVRVGVENMLQITKYDGDSVTLGTESTTYYYTDGTNDTTGTATGKTLSYSLKDFGVTYSVDTNAVELSDHEYTDANGNKVANEVSLIQAGGELVVAGGKAVAVTDQVIKSGDDTNNDYFGADQYKPTATGLYIFRRTYYEGGSNSTVKYSGYWYDSGKYYALVTDVVDGTNATVYLPDSAVTETATGDGMVVTGLDASKIKVKKTVKTDAKDTASKLTMSFVKLESGTYSNVEVGSEDTATHIKAIYSTDNTVTTDDVIFYIKLEDNWANNWTYVAKNITPTDGVSTPSNIGKALGYFYLKDDLEAGATSPKLINSVTLDSTVTQQAYVDLTYDINVILDSVQVTNDEDGKETTIGASSWSSDVAITAQTAGELSNLQWTAPAP